MQVLQHLMGVDDVEQGIGESQPVDAPLLVLEIGQSSRGGIVSRAVESFLGEINADHLPRG